MLLSKLCCERVKDAPQDAKILSHILLARAGYIKQVANGIYSMTMPCQKMSQKIQAIIREEMDACNGQEVLFPVVMPRELWETSGRYTSIGSEMVRFKDRGNRDMLLGMTHEEAAVHLANHTISSYTQLPMMIYQIQTKFRDEARSRGGLIRVREFTMKDAYSFHTTFEDMEQYYYQIHKAYNRIFHRIGLKNFIDVKSDTGMMGGSVAHEFMLLTDVGEDSIVLCNSCDYRANMEVATSIIDKYTCEEEPLKLVDTQEDKTIEDICKRFNVSEKQTAKAVVFAVKGDQEKIVIAFVRGDLEVNEAKLKKVIKQDVVAYEGGACEDVVCGQIGPIGLSDKITVVIDKSLENTKGLIVGANIPNHHYTGFNASRDIKDAQFHDISKAKAGDRCPICGGELRIENGIEIGNIFQLGTKYSKSMGMNVAGPDGQSFNPIMGCYGIGVGRAIASIAQESNDEKGLIIPISIAPWPVHMCVLRQDDPIVNEKAQALYKLLEDNKIATLYDDRNCGAGIKFNDADLMGMPIRIVVSPKSLANNSIEITIRKNRQTMNVEYDSALDTIKSLIEELMEEYR